VTTVIAGSPEYVQMAPRFFGRAFLSSRVAGGRGYVLVLGDVSRPLAFVDGDELLLEANSFPTTEAATAWIEADIAQRRRPA
jgi:hypothetical protein